MKNTDYTDCHGCSLCLLVCPVWHASNDMRYTPKGLARGLQANATAEELGEVITACTLCGACDLVCPQGIISTDVVTEQRQEILQANLKDEKYRYLHSLMNDIDYSNLPSVLSPTVLLADKIISSNQKVLRLLHHLFDTPKTIMDAWKLTECIEAGMEIPRSQRLAFIKPLRKAETVIVADGLLLRSLHRWLTDCNIVSLGQALSKIGPVRDSLSSSDFYFIDSRAYHATYSESLYYYDELRKTIGLQMNLDLQRMAQSIYAMNLPSTLEKESLTETDRIQRIFQGKNFERIVTESLEDAEILSKHCRQPVVHISELAA